MNPTDDMFPGMNECANEGPSIDFSRLEELAPSVDETHVDYSELDQYLHYPAPSHWLPEHGENSDYPYSYHQADLLRYHELQPSKDTRPSFYQASTSTYQGANWNAQSQYQYLPSYQYLQQRNSETPWSNYVWIKTTLSTVSFLLIC